MNRLSTEARAKVVSVLVEGNSLRATSRITGVARMTVEKLLRDLGGACLRFHDERVRNLSSRRIQCDEIWSFVYAKAKNVPADKRGVFGYGDVWTWTALDPDSKLMVCYMVGPRNAPMAYGFMKEVASRVSSRIQLTTDGLRWYLDAVDHAFGIDVDYAMLDKYYGKAPADASAATRYSPARFTGAQRKTIRGYPDPRHISTSMVERQNLTMRMHMRRFTRLTNGFSKKVENHVYSVALHFAYYNFCKIHQTLRVTPAMEAGISDHVWSLDELISLITPSEALKTA